MGHSDTRLLLHPAIASLNLPSELKYAEYNSYNFPG